MSDFPTLEKVVAVHRWAGRREQFWDARCTGCHWRGDIRGTGKTCIALHAEHVQAEWVKARTIEMVEQLDALPEGSVIHVPHKVTASSEEKRHGQWWPSRSTRPFPYSRRGELLPARLLWHPEADHG